MADLLVRHVDDVLVRSLHEQAAAHGRSAEAEHRRILSKALRKPHPKKLVEVLLGMPNVGEDADFARIDVGKAANGQGCPDARRGSL